MVLEDQTRWKLHRRQWTGTTEKLIEDLESAYDNAPNMFSIRIHHGGKFQSYPGRVYVSGHVDIFDVVDIDLFTIVGLNMMVVKLGYTAESEPLFYNYLRPLTSLDEGLYAFSCEEDVRYLASLVRSFKLIESSEPTKEPVCDSVTPRSLPQHDSSTPYKDFVCVSITPRLIDDVMRQLSFEETELDREVEFVDVAGSDVESSGVRNQMLVDLRNPLWQRLELRIPLWKKLELSSWYMSWKKTKEYTKK
ncbi:hypothetical protein Tco_0753077 [Tanacetum coccineum]